jgi:hypothetical protein
VQAPVRGLGAARGSMRASGQADACNFYLYFFIFFSISPHLLRAINSAAGAEEPVRRRVSSGLRGLLTGRRAREDKVERGREKTKTTRSEGEKRRRQMPAAKRWQSGRKELFVPHSQVVFHEGWCANLRQRSGGPQAFSTSAGGRDGGTERERKGPSEN